MRANRITASKLRAPPPRRGGFTLPELMIASSISLMMVGGVLMSQIYGLRLFEASNSKMQTSLYARRALNQMIADIKSAKNLKVGNATLGSFTPVSFGSSQLGNGLRLTVTTNESDYIVYYVDEVSDTLRRTTNGVTYTNIAVYVTNTQVFSLQNYAGVTLTNNANNSVVSMELGFDSSKLTALRMGSQSYYKSYRLRSKVAYRAMD